MIQAGTTVASTDTHTSDTTSAITSSTSGLTTAQAIDDTSTIVQALQPCEAQQPKRSNNGV